MTRLLAGGVLQDLGHLGHLHHKGGLSGSQIVRSTHAGEDRIHNADAEHCAAGTKLPI